jgi:serine phosphatase RsbU (regulator of sigma subunit)
MRFGYIFFIYLYCISGIYAQDWSIPYIKNYNPKDYNSGTDNWAIVQDKRGVMYFGNANGVLEYNGKHWRQYANSNQSRIRSIGIDKNNIIYVGGVGEIGYLDCDRRGDMQYVSLVDLLDEKDRTFTDVWRIHIINEAVYFQSFEAIFEYKDGKINTYKPQNTFHLSYTVNNELWVIDRGIGLKKITKGKLELIKHGDFFSDDKIYCILPLDDKYLISTYYKGIILFNPKNDKGNISERFNTPAYNYLENFGIYCSVVLNDSTYVLGTLGGGIVIINKQGEVLNIINKQNGLQAENVYYIYKDNQNNIWLALDNGITRIETGSPQSLYNDQSGLSGIVQSIKVSENKIYVATTTGLFVKNNQAGITINTKEDVLACIKQFKPVKGINSETWALHSIIINDNEKLLAGNNTGVYVIDGDEAKQISTHYTYSLNSSQHKNRIYVGTANGLAIIEYQYNHWVDYGVLTSTQGTIRTIVEDKNGDVWLGIQFEGLARVKFHTNNIHQIIKNNSYAVEWIDSAKGITSNYYNMVFKDGDDVYTGTLHGLFKWDYEKEIFLPETKFGKKHADGSRQVYLFTKGRNNDYWFFNANDNLKETCRVIIENNNKITIQQSIFNRFSDNLINVIYPLTSDITLFGGSEGIFIHNEKIYKNYSTPFYTLISKVVVAKDSVLFFGNYPNAQLLQPDSLKPVLPYKYNSLIFEFSSVCFENENNNKYKWYLEGYDSDWNNWTNESKAIYTNLPEGNYTLHVISKNSYDIESREAVYTFTVKPPWYRTMYAYIGYTLFFIAFVYGAIQLSVYRLKRSKIQLEQIVQERTAEILKQKEEIEFQKTLVEEKNKDITDSINYAKRIQNAILPAQEYIDSLFKECMVLYMPKDIVSGDFYWFTQKNNRTYFAAVDCTGHGVPGAFVSLVGSNLLNQIINSGVYESGKILEQLSLGVEQNLQKKNQQNSIRDGMDIAICCYDKDTNILEFSGAYNPLYYIRNNELFEIKPDKIPIGEVTDGKPYNYTTHKINIQKNDTFYIFSDGYADQFGGNNGKKFKYAQLKEKLLSIQHLTLQEQYNYLKNTFDVWKGNLEQVDDILLIGVRI